jgi:transcriptional regulator of acetoin/glycerol metabolism
VAGQAIDTTPAIPPATMHRRQTMNPHAVFSAQTHAQPLATAHAWTHPEIIRRSHERSKAYGLSAATRPDYAVLGVCDLALKLEQNRALCNHAFPVMATLYEQIANTHSMVVLTDAQGLVLQSLGDDDFLARANKVALRAGALWSEQQQGTNAVGTAIAEGEATTVQGDQHYLRANRFLACSSVPIFDPFGQLMGVLDVTGDSRSHHHHTLALAKMSGQMIENHLFTSAFTAALRVHFHSRPEFIGTLMEGIAAFDAEGRFLCANRSAQFQLGLPLAALQAHTLSSLFGICSGALIDRVHSGFERQVWSLCLHNGVSVFAHVEFRRLRTAYVEAVAVAHDNAAPEQGVRAPDAPAAPRAPAALHTFSNLQYLATGDAQMASLLARVRKVLDKPIAILIGGETGTGKEVLAHAIHRDSPRSGGPFVALNCASIPEALIEAELFGYAPGAYTGAAKRGSIGKIMQAQGGTLFLDEIGDMPYALQSRLLRVLQERSVTPLGSTRARAAQFGLICASNRTLRERVASGAFREDLYYRINGLQVVLPPLRTRTDLNVTIEQILRRECAMPFAVSVAPQVLAVFARHRWPGNFRQLNNVLQTACAMLEHGETEIGMGHLPADFLAELDSGGPDDNVPGGQAACAAVAPLPASAATLRMPRSVAPPGTEHATQCEPAANLNLDALAACALTQALAAHRGNVSAAARALGVSRTTLYRKMAMLKQGERA